MLYFAIAFTEIPTISVNSPIAPRKEEKKEI